MHIGLELQATRGLQAGAARRFHAQDSLDAADRRVIGAVRQVGQDDAELAVFGQPADDAVFRSGDGRGLERGHGACRAAHFEERERFVQAVGAIAFAGQRASEDALASALALGPASGRLIVGPGRRDRRRSGCWRGLATVFAGRVPRRRPRGRMPLRMRRATAPRRARKETPATRRERRDPRPASESGMPFLPLRGELQHLTSRRVGRQPLLQQGGRPPSDVRAERRCRCRCRPAAERRQRCGTSRTSRGNRFPARTSRAPRRPVGSYAVGKPDSSGRAPTAGASAALGPPALETEEVPKGGFFVDLVRQSRVGAIRDPTSCPISATNPHELVRSMLCNSVAIAT